jgi:hypothetical protein
MTLTWSRDYLAAIICRMMGTHKRFDLECYDLEACHVVRSTISQCVYSAVEVLLMLELALSRRIPDCGDRLFIQEPPKLLYPLTVEPPGSPCPGRTERPIRFVVLGLGPFTPEAIPSGPRIDKCLDSIYSRPARWQY